MLTKEQRAMAMETVLIDKQSYYDQALATWEKARQQAFKEAFEAVEGFLDLSDDTYVRISNHVPYEEWLIFKSKYLKQGK
jgi:hypothetical protein